MLTGSVVSCCNRDWVLLPSQRIFFGERPDYAVKNCLLAFLDPMFTAEQNGDVFGTSVSEAMR